MSARMVPPRGPDTGLHKAVAIVSCVALIAVLVSFSSLTADWGQQQRQAEDGYALRNDDASGHVQKSGTFCEALLSEDFWAWLLGLVGTEGEPHAISYPLNITSESDVQLDQCDGAGQPAYPASDDIVGAQGPGGSSGWWRILLVLGALAAPRCTLVVLALDEYSLGLFRMLNVCAGVGSATSVSMASAQLVGHIIAFFLCPSFIFLRPALRLRAAFPTGALFCTISTLLIGTMESVASILILVAQPSQRQQGEVPRDPLRSSVTAARLAAVATGCLDAMRVWLLVTWGEIAVFLWVVVMATDIHYCTMPAAKTMVSISRLVTYRFFVGSWALPPVAPDADAPTDEHPLDPSAVFADVDIFEEDNDIALMSSVMSMEVILALIMAIFIRCCSWAWSLAQGRGREAGGIDARGIGGTWNQLARVLVDIEASFASIVAGGDVVQQRSADVSTVHFPPALELPFWYEPSNERFRCPITMMPMREPAIATCSGITYERSAAESWMSRHNREPTTREFLDQGNGAGTTGAVRRGTHLVPNLLIRALIEDDIEISRAEHELLMEKLLAKRDAKKKRSLRRRQRPRAPNREGGQENVGPPPEPASSRGTTAADPFSSLEHTWPALDMAIFEQGGDSEGGPESDASLTEPARIRSRSATNRSP